MLYSKNAPPCYNLWQLVILCLVKYHNVADTNIGMDFSVRKNRVDTILQTTDPNIVSCHNLHHYLLLWWTISPQHVTPLLWYLWRYVWSKSLSHCCFCAVMSCTPCYSNHPMQIDPQTLIDIDATHINMTVESRYMSITSQYDFLRILLWQTILAHYDACVQMLAHPHRSRFTTLFRK